MGEEMKRCLFTILFFRLVFILFAQPTSIPSISWAYGDTLDQLKIKNRNITFNTTGLANEYKVIEGRNPTITETTFKFDEKGRLLLISWRKVGAALDVYEPLFNKYKAIYGTPTSNNEFGPNPQLTFASANSSFENSKGSVNIVLVAPLNNVNIPYVVLIEIYKYQEGTLSDDSRTTNNENAKKLFYIEWNRDGTVNIEKILQNGDLINKPIGEEYRSFRGKYSNSRGEWVSYSEKNVSINYHVSDDNTLSHLSITYTFTNFDEANNFLKNYCKILGSENIRNITDDELKKLSEMENVGGAGLGIIIKDNIRHDMMIGFNKKKNLYEVMDSMQENKL
jgi:hypothetical protein